MDDLVSVIVPMYNCQRFIGECIDSLLCQTYKNIEIVLVDDGSSDGTADEVKSYCNNHPNIRYIYQKNSGVSAARNTGIRNSSGKYIMFQDGDDYLKNVTIETLVADLYNNACDVVYGNFNLKYENRIIERKERIPSGSYTKAEYESIFIDDGTLSGFTFGSVCCALFKREIIEKHNIYFDSEVKINEDGLFNICYLLFASSLYYDGRCFYYYRQWKESGKKEYNELSEQLNLCTQKVEDMLCNNCDSLTKFGDGIDNRRASCVFFQSVNLIEGSKKPRLKELKRLWDQNEKVCRVIDLSRLNRYKREIWKMVIRKHALSFWVLVALIYPVLKKRVRR